METHRAVMGALIFILLIVGGNFVMYAIARGASRPNQKSFLETLGKSLDSSTQKKDEPMDELRRRVRELDGGKKEKSEDSE
jgi:hypothetical protein